MSVNRFLLLVCIAFSANAFGQLSAERTALARMSKGKWAKAEQSLKKALRKDSSSVEASMVYAQWYFSNENPRFNIDSAYRFIQSALLDYAHVDLRQRERMQRFPLDSTILLGLKEQIDSAAFERAKGINSEEGYNNFLDKFTYTKHFKNAIELRDEVSFLDALKINTYQSFNQYLRKYPDSHRAEEAQTRYDRLLFEEKTRDGKLKSFTTFYQTNPKSPYRDVALKEIFEIGTVSGELNDYLKFISNYRDGKQFVRKASDVAFHIAMQLNLNVPKIILTDSIQKVIKGNEDFLVPFLKNGKFGFMNGLGTEIIAAQFDEIGEEYLCGNVIEDCLVTSKGMISRSNKLIMTGKIEAINDLGFGILLVSTNGCKKLLHKSGFLLIEDCVDEARIVANHFVAVRKNKNWGLYAFSGRKISTENYENIYSEDEIIVFSRKGKKILNTPEQVIGAADKNPLPDKMVFDEVRKLSADKVLVKNGSLEGVVNSKLKYEVPLDRQGLLLTSFGFTKRVLNKVYTVGLSESIDKEAFTEIKPYLNWLGLFQSNHTKLYHIPSSKIIEDNLDSLWFTNRLAMASRGDSTKVIFGSGRKMIFDNSTKVNFVKSPDSVRYFYLEERSKKQLYDVDNGTKRFAIEADRIEDIGYHLFIVEHKGKKGLVGIDGRWVLPLEYDAIVKSSTDYISLLRDKKIGLYSLKNRKLYKSTYERNLTFFNEAILVAFMDGYYGFINNDAQPISHFEFDEVRPWSDSAAMVRKDFRWMVYHVYDKKVMFDQIKDYRLIKDTPEEKIAIIHKENQFGVLSSKRGVIIPPTFSDVLNLGSAERQLYFTEKSVEEADLFVVIYYDENGKLIRRQIYESEEYDRIYCR